jgi:hypothetical protein
MPLLVLPLELWQKILELLEVLDAIAISKAHPRFFGARIESTQAIRFYNAINSFMCFTYIPYGFDLPYPYGYFACWSSSLVYSL